MIPTTHTVVPFLLAMFIAVAGMPTNVFQICRRSLGTLEVEPWRQRSTALARAVSAATTWLIALLRLRVPAACAAAVLLALLASDLSAADAGVLIATTVPAVTVDALRTERAQLVREAEALQSADGSFADDQARATFDAKMAKVEQLDTQMRQAAAPPPAVDASRAAAVQKEERDRGIAVRALCRAHKMDDAFADAQIASGASLETVRAAILDKLVARTGTVETRHAGGPDVKMGEDARDKWLRGAAAWLMVRSGMAALVAKHEGVSADKIDAGEFRGLTLLDLARESLVRAGQQVRGLDKMSLAGLAMSFRSNYQTTSDFATLLENTMHKVLRAAYALQPDTWSLWCGTGTVSDFRLHNWYRMGSLTELQDLNEVGEFKNKAIPDAEKATFSAKTKGNIIAISRQVIVNDDMGAVMRLTEMLGRAGKLTIEKAVYALISANSGLGPTQSDAQPLFHANRNNVNATGSALAVDALDADRVVMAQQKDVNGVDFIDLRPSVLLVPVGLGGTARVINAMEFDGTTSKFQVPNKVRGLFQTIVDTPRLAGTRRYLFADPTMAPVFMVSFLEGQREPVLETQDGWRTDGVEMKARLDFGVDVVDFRGGVTNAGA